MFSALARLSHPKHFEPTTRRIANACQGGGAGAGTLGRFNVQPVRGPLAPPSSLRLGAINGQSGANSCATGVFADKPAPVAPVKRLNELVPYVPPCKALVVAGDVTFGSVSGELRRKQIESCRSKTAAESGAQPPESSTQPQTADLGRGDAALDKKPQIIIPTAADVHNYVAPQEDAVVIALERNGGTGCAVADSRSMGAFFFYPTQHLKDSHHINRHEYNAHHNQAYEKNTGKQNPHRAPFGGPIVTRGIIKPKTKFFQLIGNMPAAGGSESQLISHVRAALQGGSGEGVWIGNFLLHYVPLNQVDARTKIALKWDFKPGELFLSGMEATGEFEVDGGLIGEQDPETLIDPKTGQPYTQTYSGGSWQWVLVDAEHAKRNMTVKRVFRLPDTTPSAENSRDLVPLRR